MVSIGKVNNKTSFKGNFRLLLMKKEMRNFSLSVSNLRLKGKRLQEGHRCNYEKSSAVQSGMQSECI